MAHTRLIKPKRGRSLLVRPLRDGDVITAVDLTPVATPDDVHKAFNLAHEQDRAYVAVLVQTKNGAQWLSVSISATKS